ncbi:MAG: DUF4446 family protein [Firmicutes bacterium]|nr:DUF4446 family protein [Bacillota bacterium]
MMDNYVLIGASALTVILFIFCLILSSRLSNLSKRYREFMTGGNGVSLEGTLINLQGEVQAVRDEIRKNRQQMSLLGTTMTSTLQGIGVVRFNAFQDTGSDLSFAVALLDGNSRGVVMSSIYGREESRMYAKPIQAGTSTYQLSKEEQEALQQAKLMIATVQESLTGKL